MEYPEDLKKYLRLARLLELGCGSYLRGTRHEDEDGHRPRHIEDEIGVWGEITGVDIVPLGKEPVGWRFVQGDILTEELWQAVGTGYDFVRANALFSFFDSRRISPGFTPRGKRVYTPLGEQTVENPLNDPDYFFGVDFVLTRVHRILEKNGAFHIDHCEASLVKCIPNYIYGCGRVKNIEHLTSLPWTVQIQKAEDYMP